MLDKLSSLFKKKKTPQETPKKNSKEKALSSAKATQKTLTPAVVATPAPAIVIPKAATPAVNIAGSTLSHEEQERILAMRRKVPVHIIILKFFSLVVFTIVLMGYIAMKADTEPTNAYLAIFGQTQNTGLRHKELTGQTERLNQWISQLEMDIQDKKRRLKAQDFYQYQDQIDRIKNGKMIWFDTYTETGTIANYGILDSFKRIEEYYDFLNEYFQQAKNEPYHPILIFNDVSVKNLFVSRKNSSVSVDVSNVFGNVFYLATEFVETMNAFPFFKNGEVKNFSRQENAEGEESMSFSVTFQTQAPEETDTDDENFIYYDYWLKETKNIYQRAKGRNTPTIPKTTPRIRTQ